MNRTASYIYTDLACEAYERTDSVNASGVSYNEYDADGIKITDLRITNSDGEKALGKPIGSYITIGTRPAKKLTAYWFAGLATETSPPTPSVL